MNVRRTLVWSNLCDVSMGLYYQKLHRDISPRLQREFSVLSMSDESRPVHVCERSRWTESYPHWSLCSSAHTTPPLQCLYTIFQISVPTSQKIRCFSFNIWRHNPCFSRIHSDSRPPLGFEQSHWQIKQRLLLSCFHGSVLATATSFATVSVDSVVAIFVKILI
jgi:hypothetical protein